MAQKKYSKKKLAFFKKHIEAKLKNLTDDLDDSRGNLESNIGGSAGLAQESVYSVHMADAGTDSYEREKGYHLINRKTDYIKARAESDSFALKKKLKHILKAQLKNFFEFHFRIYIYLVGNNYFLFITSGNNKIIYTEWKFSYEHGSKNKHPSFLN